MAIKKKLRGLADPLLEEVVCGLEETLKDKKVDNAVTGSGERTFSGDPLLRVVEKYHQNEHADLASKITMQEGLLLKRHKKNSLYANHIEGTYDPILQEYVLPRQALHDLIAFEEDIKKKQALFKEMAERKHNLECPEVLLKHTKRGSLHHREALYDPILHEYVVPKQLSLLTAHAFEKDKENKRRLFKEMSMRKRHNLNEREFFCDPLVHVYRANDIDEVDE